MASLMNAAAMLLFWTVGLLGFAYFGPPQWTSWVSNQAWVQDEVFVRVREINKIGVTVIMVEQNARRCLQIVDRGYVLDQGKNAYEGTGKSLSTDPKVIELYLGTLAKK